MNYSKRHNKFLLPAPAKVIRESLCRAESEIFNVVNYKIIYRILWKHWQKHKPFGFRKAK